MCLLKMSCSDTESEPFPSSESEYEPEDYSSSEPSDSGKYAWLQIQWLHFKNSEPYKIFYKETLNEDYPFNAISLLPNRRGAPKMFKAIELSSLYQGPLEIHDKKKKNMEELFQFIPPIHQNYLLQGCNWKL
uniref:Uncharacterized protein n=1 Tax=Photinus pyralis TaxID=7054 RepID=A0A1Y1LH26_PHOPY